MIKPHFRKKSSRRTSDRNIINGNACIIIKSYRINIGTVGTNKFDGNFVGVVR